MPKKTRKKKKGKNPLLVACDVYRPAAIEQLKVLGSSIGIEVYSEVGNNDPIGIAKKSLNYAKEKKNNIIIIKTV